MLNKKAFVGKLFGQISQKEVFKIAEQTGFHRRKHRKISAINFLWSLCILSFQGRDCSFLGIAQYMSLLTHKTISKVGVFKRLSPRSVDFMEQLLSKMLDINLKRGSFFPPKILKGFSKVLIQDSTNIPLAIGFRKDFKGATKGNAGIKLDTIFNLKTFSFVRLSLRAAVNPDQKDSKHILTLASKNSLIIRDLGYYINDVFCEIIKKGAYFLTRYCYHRPIYAHDGETIEIYKELEKAEENLITMKIFLDKEGKSACRLVAFRVPEAEMNLRIRKARRIATKKQRSLSKKFLSSLKWVVLITNTKEEQLPAKSLYEIYLVRWQIELIFKTWKSHFGFRQINAIKSLNTLKTIIYAKLIMMLMTYNLYANMSLSRKSQFSYLKFIKLLKWNIPLWFLQESNDQKSFKKSIHVFLLFIDKYSCFEKRKRKTTMETLCSLS